MIRIGDFQSWIFLYSMHKILEISEESKSWKMLRFLKNSSEKLNSGTSVVALFYETIEFSSLTFPQFK